MRQVTVKRGGLQVVGDMNILSFMWEMLMLILSIAVDLLVITLSIVGAIPNFSPLIIVPFVLFAISTTSSGVKSTSANTPIVSTVPDALVIAFVEVLGVNKPAAARIGTINKLTLFPGTPPMLCLS